MDPPQPQPAPIQQNQPPPPPPQCTKTKACTNEGYVCAAHGCTKVVCRSCYKEVLNKNKIRLDDALPEELAACTVKCHRKAVKSGAQQPAVRPNGSSGDTNRQYTSWDTDTCNGEYEGSSEALLLDCWLKTPGNFAKWRGNKRGLTAKKEIQQEIADYINEAARRRGINRHRTESKVGDKIHSFQTKFRETLNWINQTGQGILE